MTAETIGTTILVVAKTLGMDPGLLRLIGLMQASRMGLHVQEGREGSIVVLRELVTDRVYRAVAPSGYHGRKGELWFARVLPPPSAGSVENVVFTTRTPCASRVFRSGRPTSAATCPWRLASRRASAT
jgi:hypothetical protein